MSPDEGAVGVPKTSQAYDDLKLKIMVGEESSPVIGLVTLFMVVIVTLLMRGAFNDLSANGTSARRSTIPGSWVHLFRYPSVLATNLSMNVMVEREFERLPAADAILLCVALTTGRISIEMASFEAVVVLYCSE
jgi:hypothetical protein